MSILQSDYLIGNTRLDIQAADVAYPITLGVASGFDVGQLAVSNATSLTGATTLTLNSTGGTSDIVLNAGNSVSLSGKNMFNVNSVELNPTTDPSKPYALWANAAGAYFSQGTSGGSTKLARSLREAYGTGAEDANIAVETGRPVHMYDVSDVGTQIFGVISNAGDGIFSVSNAAVYVNRFAYLSDLQVDGKSQFNGDVNIAGNMSVTGNITTINSEQVNLQDSVLYLNSGYTTTAGKAGGFAVNYLPTSNTATATATFTPGVTATSNPIILGMTTDPSGWAVDGVVIQISGSVTNDGIYEVLSSNATTIIVRGVGTSAVSTPLKDIVANQFVSEVSTAGVKITQVNVAIMRSNPTTGSFQVSKGSTSTEINSAFKNLGDVSFTGTAPTTNAISRYGDVSGGNIIASGVTIDNSNNMTGVANLSAGNLSVTGSLAGSLANITTAANSTALTASNAFGPRYSVQLNHLQTTTATPTSMATIPVGVNNATVTLRAYIVCKQQGTANHMGINLDAAFLADGSGNLTLIAAPSRAIFRTGFAPGVTATVVAVGTGFAIRVTGAAATINWQASTEYTIGLGFA